MQSSLGFVWGGSHEEADLIHISTAFKASNMNSTGMSNHSKPASYMMSKHADASGQVNNSIYDDTGRGEKSLKVHRLLDKARKVIAVENRKLMKADTKLKGTTGGKSAFMSAGAHIMGG